MKKRVLSLFMALALCLSMTPEVSFAEEAGAVTKQEAQSGESTADVYIAGNSNDRDTTGGDTKGSDTTGNDIIGGNTTGNDVSGNNVSGGDAAGQNAEKNAAVLAVQALIDALPDEVTAENEEAIGEQLAAIDAAMGALNDEQLAELDITRLEKIYNAMNAPALVAVQAGEHTAEHVGMTKWTDNTQLPQTADRYYLDTDVKLTETWKPANGTVLCLNGHSITMEKNGIDVITIGIGVTFTLYDCNDSNNGKGIITHAASTTSYTGCGVKVTGGTFNMYGGTISDNKVTEHGGGVYVENSYNSIKGNVSGTFNMYGGTISGNKASADHGRGGGVYVYNSTFNMTDGEITGNTAYYGGGVGLTSYAVFHMDGGTIRANSLNNQYSVNGGGVWVDNGCSFIVSGNAMVSGNTDHSNNNSNNVELASGQTIAIAGKLAGSIGVYTYVTPALTKPVTIAKAADGYDGLSEDVAHITSDSDKGYCPFFVDGVVKLYTTQPQKHPICGKTCEHKDQHDDVIWEGISNLNDIKGDGYYYLTESVDLTATWTCSSDVKLCLNGKNITQTTEKKAVIEITKDGKLTLTDCVDDSTKYGMITHPDSTEGIGVVVDGGTFEMYGGSITNNQSGGVQVHGGRFTMYDGLITKNTSLEGGGVYIESGIGTSQPPTYDEATFEMYGGTISNNRAQKNEYSNGYGGGVYVGTYYNTVNGKSPANFIMHGGTISDNTASRDGGGVYVMGTFTMQDGSIFKNTATYYGSAVYVWNTFTMQGGSITENYILDPRNADVDYDGGVYVTSGSTITVSGTAKITNNQFYHNYYGTRASSNVLLSTGEIITIGEGGLKEGAKIGVKQRAEIKEGKTVVIAQGESEGYMPTETDLAAFVSDDDTYTTRLKDNAVVLANGDPHVHSICATTDCTHEGIHDGHDENQVWESITSLDEITTSGYYYLTKDVTLADAAWTCNVKGEVYLCLNGKKIIGVADKTVIIVSSTASLNITDCSTDETGNEVGEITHADGDKGAGISNNGTLTLWKGNITKNKNSSYSCGGVYVNSGSKFTMHGGSITGNTGKDCGGVWVEDNGTFNMDGGDITENKGTEYENAGGVFVKGTFNMDGGSISGNTSQYARGGGGVYVLAYSTFNMGGGDITGNTAGSQGGGGVFVEAYGTFEMTDGVITDNNGKGGGVYLDSGIFNLKENGSITGNTNNSSSGGGGVYLNGGTFTMEGGSITENKGMSSSAGGVYLNSGIFNMKSGKISDNEMGSSSTNGGVHVGSNDSTATSTATFTMSGGSITGNKSTQYGGGVYVDATGTFEMTGGDITGNTSSSNGGGVYVASGGTFTMTKESTGKIAENTSNYGGGVYIYGTFTMDGGSITGNKCNYNGGGVNVARNGGFAMSGGSIAGNTAKYYGGGVNVYGLGTFTMSGGSITGNTADSYGGGVNVMNGSTSDGKAGGTFKMSGGIITGNNANTGAGGVYVGAYKSTFTVSGAVQIKDNWQEGTLGADGLYEKGESGTKNNVLLCGNANDDKYFATITINGLTADAKIGVSKFIDNLPTSGEAVKIATGASDNSLNYTDIFTSDVAEQGYVVTQKGIELYLEVHQHSWIYTASGETITAICQNTATCPKPDGGSVTISKPEHETYGDGKKITAVLKGVNWAAGDLNNVTYKDKDGNEMTVIPTNAGTYTASLILKGADNKSVTASVEYTIAKAKPTKDDFNFEPADTLIYDGTPKLAKVEAKDGISGMGDATVVMYYRNGIPVDEPIDAGDYTVEVSVAEGDNYIGVNYLYNDWKFTIAKSDVVPDVELNDNMIYTGSQIEPDVTVTVGNTVLGQGTDYSVEYGKNIDAGKNAGTVTVKATADGNYAFADVTKEFNIDKALQSLEFEPNNVKKTYGDEAFSNLVTGVVKGKVTYSSDNEDVATVNEKTGEVTIVGAGSACITAKAEATQNYEANSATYVLAVEAAKIHIVGAKVDDKDYDGKVAADVTSVSFADENNNILDGLVFPDDYTAVGSFSDENAGKDKDVTVRVSLLNENYELIGNTTCTTTATINKKAISIGNAAAVDRNYEKDKTSVEISVTFNGATLIKGTDYNVTGKMDDDNAGTKDVAVEVTLINKAADNYILADNKTTKTVTINKVTPEIDAVSEQTIVKNGVAVDISKWASTNNTDTDAKLIYTLVDTPAGITLDGVSLTAANAASTVSSFEIRVTADATTNFTEPEEKIITVTVVDKTDAGVSITGATNKTYGDGSFTLTAKKTAPDGGIWSWSSTDSDVLEITSGADTETPTIQVKKVGSAILTVTYSSDTHYGSANVTITVAAKGITEEMIAAIPDEDYTGSAIEPTPEVRDGGTKLIPGTDFDYSYSNNINAGIATLTITGKGNYEGTASKDFTISKKSIKGATIELEAGSLPYTGSEQTVNITSVTLERWADTITYEIVSGDKATDAGTVTLKIKGTGNYTGTAETTWTITKIDPKLADFDVTPDLTTALTYDGAAKTVTVNTKTGISGMGDITVKYNDSTEAPTDAGSYAVTIDVKNGSNYNDMTDIAAGTLTIHKAAAPTLTDIQEGCRYTLTGEKTVDLAELVAGATNYTLGEAAGDAEILSDASVDADGVLKYTLTGTGKIGDTVTLPVTITSANYEDAAVKVVITLTEKDNQEALLVTGDNTVVYGGTLTLGTTGGSGTGEVTYRIDTENSTGEATIEGNVLTPVKVGRITILATKAGDSVYNEITSAPFVITITPATPTGEPKYIEITVEGKTLADAGLTLIGSTISLTEGTLEWIDDDGNALSSDTKVEVNKTYKWRFTPTDTNYEILTGEVELYHVDLPAITSQPKNVSVKAGERAVFEVTATGTDVTYQWQIDRNDGKGFVNLNGANSAAYTSGITDADCNGFKYQCVIRNAAGSVTTDTVTLTITVQYTITATAGVHGSISPSGAVEVEEGSSQTFVITADTGYEIESLKVDGKAVSAAASYTFTDVKAAHTIEVTFKAVVYRIISGADGAWTQNTDGSLVISGDGEFAKFQNVLVDGRVIGTENYTAAEGSTIITLKADFLSTLSEGSHSFEIVWADGSASTHFTVARNTSGDNNGNNNSNNDNNSSDNAGSNDNTTDKSVIAPKTGDASRDALWMVLLVVASIAGLAGAAEIVVIRKKSNDK